MHWMQTDKRKMHLMQIFYSGEKVSIINILQHKQERPAWRDEPLRAERESLDLEQIGQLVISLSPETGEH